MIIDTIVNYFIKERNIQKKISVLHTLVQRCGKAMIKLKHVLKSKEDIHCSFPFQMILAITDVMLDLENLAPYTESLIIASNLYRKSK